MALDPKDLANRQRVIDALVVPLGNFQTADLSTAAGATSLPTNATVATLQAIGNNVSYRDDGTAATNSSGGSFGGSILYSGQAPFLYTGDLNALSMIEAVSTSTAYVNIMYYAT